ncbi:MAG: 16S rRNA (guanine(527)-N(7))-methyltransferase RsmG [Chloroflexi bacterium]|nr:16S rRNA (guanine(527)-N(7))-methyltransferase RsmG [Chloroflexota bacterium]
MLSAEWVQFGQRAAQLGVQLTEQQIAQFMQYEALLLLWNERMNLTAVRQPAEIRIRHFLDSLSCATVMGDLNGRSLIDVGSGAGFPGLPLKILVPAMKVTLVESVAKKGQFLQTVADELGLNDVTVLTERVEKLGQSSLHRQQYDWATARAVAILPVLAEYLLPLCKVGGSMLAQKGENVAVEVVAAGKAIELLGGGKSKTVSIKLPQREQLHYLLTVAKVANTPAKFPRRVGVPGKRPLSA